MKVSTGLIHGYAVENWDDLTNYVIEVERMGVDSIWSPEAWGFDGATPLAYLAAKTSKIKLGTGILQVGARTPTKHSANGHVAALNVWREVFTRSRN